ncbi:PilZ domain-containing protein [Sphingomonas phyllosphaerae]|uniref:PilZ domain-containing protein n=1 Tax=Sphingomonas phyllosphaerae TaxID=257003 RepID=UPI0024136439|nr:PilZ domain-containing protein [Sphingomonas phyllosphaerae]
MSGPVSSDSTKHELQPRAERHRVMLGALIERFGHGGATRHRVRDLSTTGVRVDQAERLQRGATVLVTVGSLAAVGATVIWVEQGAAGLRFAQPIDPDDARSKTFVAKPSAPTRQRDEPLGKAGWLGHIRGAYDR